MTNIFNPIYIKENPMLFYVFVFVIIFIIVLTMIFVIKEINNLIKI
jgi:hypothetical protein